MKSTYLCGDKITLADVLVYNELSQYMALVDMKIEYIDKHLKLSKLHRWLDKMNLNEYIKVIDEQMKKNLKKYKFD